MKGTLCQDSFGSILGTERHVRLRWLRRIEELRRAIEPKAAATSAVATDTDTVDTAGLDRVTGTDDAAVPELPSSAVTSPTDTDGSAGVTGPGPSSSMIVPTPAASPITAPTGADRASLKVSFLSAVESPITPTSTVLVCSPAAKTSDVVGTAV